MAEENKGIDYALEDQILRMLEGKFVNIESEEKKRELVVEAIKSVDPSASPEKVNAIISDMEDLSPITEMLDDEHIEDIMINNTQNIFVYDSRQGQVKRQERIDSTEILSRFVGKLKLYSTNSLSKGNILDVHLPSKSRVNIISSPRGYDITIRNFRKAPFSIIDLINSGTLDYSIAARLWLYIDGFKVRPANLLIGGMPASGKTTLLNSLFSFLRPEQRVVTIEETYELDTSTQENCVNLETNEDMPMEALVKNALRMRPDMIIIGEVRGEEANDMITAMNVGKIVLGTIHASSSRDIINRLQHSPMNVPKDILPVIDALVVLSQVYKNNVPTRKIIQISELSGIETQVLLSDLYKFDYKTFKSSPILPSVTYRDTLSQILGVPPPDLLAEERVRALILEQLNKLNRRSIKDISEAVKAYYDNPEALLKSIGLNDIYPIVRV
jgi:flagellar protein FlaI